MVFKAKSKVGVYHHSFEGKHFFDFYFGEGLPSEMGKNLEIKKVGVVDIPGCFSTELESALARPVGKNRFLKTLERFLQIYSNLKDNSYFHLGSIHYRPKNSPYELESNYYYPKEGLPVGVGKGLPYWLEEAALTHLVSLRITHVQSVEKPEEPRVKQLTRIGLQIGKRTFILHWIGALKRGQAQVLAAKGKK